VKAPTVIGPPRVEHRDARSYVGIRATAPYSGMFAVITERLKDLRAWVKRNGLSEEGPFFLRYLVIDMRGPMELEVGFMTRSTHQGDTQVRPGTLPAGRYVSLTYRGKALASTKALLDWARTNGLSLDRHDVPEGDAFACRYEAYLTDYRKESRKLLWDIDLAIRLKD
jgi:effector-binding domain-containing protein